MEGSVRKKQTILIVLEILILIISIAAITLKTDTVILGGTGDDENPYQIGPLVTKSN